MFNVEMYLCLNRPFVLQQAVHMKYSTYKTLSKNRIQIGTLQSALQWLSRVNQKLEGVAVNSKQSEDKNDAISW